MCRSNIDEKCSMNSWFIRLMHQYSAINFKRFMDLGVHPGQIPVLRAVHEHEGISLREMADILHIKPPTVTVTVKRLEKAGFLCRKPDWRDSRVSRIYETEKGKALSCDIQAQVYESERQLLEGFSKEEKEQLCEFFRRMSANLIKKGAPCISEELEPQMMPPVPEATEEECITSMNGTSNAEWVSLMPEAPEEGHVSPLADMDTENREERNEQEW